MSASLKHREFDRTLREYAKVSKTAWPDLCNRKALFICIKAQNETPKTAWEAARAQLGAHLASVIGKRGKELKRKVLSLGDKYYDTLAVKIIVARLRRAGKAIPDAATLKTMALQFVKARAASTGFIKSGWRPAIQILKRRTRGASVKTDPTARQVGQAKGGAEAARPGDATKAVIWNMAQAQKFGTKHPQSLYEFGGPALQKAFADETRTTREEIERRMRGDARSVGIKTN